MKMWRKLVDNFIFIWRGFFELLLCCYWQTGLGFLLLLIQSTHGVSGNVFLLEENSLYKH